MARNGADVDLMADPYDVWLETFGGQPNSDFQTSWAEAKYGSLADAEWAMRRDDFERGELINNVDEAF